MRPCDNNNNNNVNVYSALAIYREKELKTCDCMCEKLTGLREGKKSVQSSYSNDDNHS